MSWRKQPKPQNKPTEPDLCPCGAEATQWTESGPSCDLHLRVRAWQGECIDGVWGPSIPCYQGIDRVYRAEPLHREHLANFYAAFHWDVEGTDNE